MQPQQAVYTRTHPQLSCPALQASSLQTSNDRPPEAATTTLPSAQIWGTVTVKSGMAWVLGRPAGYKGQDLTPFNTLWCLRVQMVLGGSVGT